MMVLLFWLAAVSLVHIYVGYEALLRLAVRLLRPERRPWSDYQPSLSLLLTVHDEEQQIIPRLEDILAQDYQKLEIVVASDGSKDRTDELVRSFAAAHLECSIRLVALTSQGGKSAAQNQAVPLLKGEVVVLTDAAARFAPGFLARMAAAYDDPSVGGVGGQVAFREDGSDIARGQGRYWRSEMTIRDCESCLGILAIASGQAMSFRRSLFRPLPEHVGDDCIIPLDVVASGARMLHEPEAIAYDVNETATGREIKVRARMTARNWQGTWRHPQLLSPLRHPGYALALWSHKLMRWLSPLFLALLGVTSLLLADRPFYGFVLTLGLAFAALAAAGAWGRGRQGTFWRIAGLAWAFLVAQLGFLLGLWRVARGQKIFAYNTGQHLM